MKKNVLEKIIILFILVCVLITLVACGESSSGNKSEKNTPEKLIKEFYSEIRNNKIENAKKYFNVEALAACEVIDDFNIKFNDAYDMMFHLNEDVDYFKDNYKDFVEALKSEERELDENTIKELKGLLDEAEISILEMVNNLSKKSDLEIQSIKKDDKYGIKMKNIETYEITLGKENDEETTESFDILIVSANDEYYILAIDVY